MKVWGPLIFAVFVAAMFVACSNLSSGSGITMTPPVTQSMPLDNDLDTSSPSMNDNGIEDPTDGTFETAPPSPSPTPSPSPSPTSTPDQGG